MTTTSPVLYIPADQAGKRLDQVLAALYPDYSRARLQQWLRQGHILLDGQAQQQRYRVKGGEKVELTVPDIQAIEDQGQSIPLDIVYQDEAVLVLNKPAGMIVHPGAGNPDGTLLNAVLHHFPAANKLPRAGIVHRLDKDTTGLMVIARDERSRLSLVGQLKDRTVKREYLAVVNGVMVAGRTVDAAIGRHPHFRTRMAVLERGKPAVSHVRVVTKYRAHSLLSVNLESGRTHQVRVHLSHLHYPIVGDAMYGGAKIPPNITDKLRNQLLNFRRQALHACELTLQHPHSGETLSWQRNPPPDMQALIDALAEDALTVRHKA